MSITTREFEGFQIEDNDSYVVSINQRSGPINLNCQEVIAVALKNNCIYGNGQTDNDIVNVYKRDYSFVSHGNIYKLRSTEEWRLARESFVSLNPNLTEEQKARLAKSDSQKNGNSSTGDTIKFTNTNASNLGKAIFENLDTSYKKYFSNFDLTNESWNANTLKGDLARDAISAFNYSVMNSLAYQDMLNRIAEKEKAEKEKAESRKQLESKAVAMLKVMGAKKEDSDYQEKLQGLLDIMVSE